MILSDFDIKAALAQGRIKISSNNLDASCFQPASLELHLGPNVIRFYQDGNTKNEVYHKDDIITLHPNEFLLVETAETIYIDNTLSANVEGKSSLGRQGIFIHISAGFIDPGFDGILTLEVYNACPSIKQLKVNQKICQVKFQQLITPAERPYGHKELNSHYQFSTKVEVSRQ